MMSPEQASEVLDTIMPKMTSSPEQVEIMQAINLAQHALSEYDPTSKGKKVFVDEVKFKEVMSKYKVLTEEFIDEMVAKLHANGAFYT